MRLRPLVVVLAIVAVDYAIWSSSLAGGSDLAGMVSGLTLPPLIAVLLVLLAVNVVRGLGDVTIPRLKRATKRTSAGLPAGAAPPAIMGSSTEDEAAAASSRASSPKIAV